MKKILAVATFVVAGAGSVAAGAAATFPNFQGSDTLFRITLEEVGPKTGQIFAAPIPSFLGPSGTTGLCANASSLEYLGGGSGAGETDMTSATPSQDVAPMSRFLQGTPVKTGGAAGATCANSNGTLADGIVIGLDGLSIVTSSANGTDETCNATSNVNCTVAAGQVATAGLAYDSAGNGGAPNVSAAQRAAAPYLTAPSGGFPAFTFASWHDVLDILYAGFVDPAFHASDPEVGKNCASSLRFALANNYGDMFENPSCASSVPGDSRGVCKQVQHIFRRDDASGTSDIFGALLGLSPSAAFNKNQVPAKLGTFFLGADPFCNDLANNTLAAGVINGVKAATNANAAWGTVWPGSNPATAIPNDDQDFDPIRRACVGSNFAKPGEQVCERGTFDALNTMVTGSGTTVTYACGATGSGTCPVNPQTGVQETCLGGQCWDGTGTLGLELPVITTNTIGTDPVNTSLNDQYNLVTASGTPTTTNACCSNLTTINKCVSVAQILTVQVPNGTGKPFDGLCPNGDESQTAGGTCWTPVDANGNPNCWSTATPQLFNGADGRQGIVGIGTGATSGGGPAVNTIDPRVWNLVSYTFVAGAWLPNVDDSARPLTGAYYRIHTSQSLLANSLGSCSTAAGTAVCALTDATDQIGCLVQASPCSLGYAGRHATQVFGPINQTVGGKPAAVCAQGGASFHVKAVPDAAACILNFSYPYSRKLYLDAASGFSALTASGAGPNQAAELALATCESTASNISQPLSFEGFIPLPTSVNGGNPYCEDFNEFMLCGSPLSGVTSNANACANNPSVLPGSAGSTICGNGVVDAYEDCDQGTAGVDNTGAVVQLSTATSDPTTFANGFPGSACSNTCRFTK